METAVLRDAMRLLLTGLGDAYRPLGVGELRIMRHSGRLNDGMLFSPQDYLLTMRFRVGPPQSPMRITVATGSNLIHAVKDAGAGERSGGGSPLVREAASALPIDVDLVLGAWMVQVEELLSLRPGQKLILPDGADARLTAQGITLRQVKTELNGPCISIEIK
jgi:hypothetical protein